MKITVVGDTLLDADAHGAARRLLPDNPVPVVDIDHVDHRPGGAGLAAALLAAVGHDVTLVTVLSDDEESERLLSALAPVTVVAPRLPQPTPVKRRVLADGHLVTRLDENCQDARNEVTDEMLRAVHDADAVLVSDYGRGLVAEEALREALDEAARRIPVVWDPHPSGPPPVPHTRTVTPNFSEATTLAGVEADETSIPAAHAAGTGLLEQWSVASVIVTLGSRGALILDDGGARFSPATRSVSGDECGAGDCFAGRVAASLASGDDLMSAVDRAVSETAEYIALGGAGTYLRTVDEEAPEPPAEPSFTPASAIARAESVRARGGTVVATGGCYDLLHAGHARALSAARRMGDTLIVLLNSDESVRRLKGETRPIVEAQDRAELLLALDCVDEVVIFDEDTPVSALESIRPDIWVKSDDYRSADLAEARAMAAWGGRLVTVPFVPARSTSRLASALNGLEAPAAPAAPTPADHSRTPTAEDVTV
ncbi:rfaE bifunctional protein kinase chain/domain/rfaE bifunctional protein nucleotidyltransferase chain/domain [Brevibacterium sanguinis]|uniref:RfaE bifunctional protein kinase chain/domain/rfaE bifunctional protein nucleotidyltransferase chain/domain n=2 Tax=Brevibacterium TaxID=1696 RepID=A0A366IKX6_9MICO|nr:MULTISPECIES: PfkB family carbohydrate kinase [Brevibacterium]RBP65443.1 rfaE bifunctional protein kinase chain/domain/rfaE bifunctional protein nucleotidyltransferase chain/domain [Brevibacterium sanguinis]RBP72077.1 rfaE bifunctional protein kinase chain/domain/rfaE bifunctional protein nucleotidyltransferase chain/domain [Brevibacterium celere]